MNAAITKVRNGSWRVARNQRIARMYWRFYVEPKCRGLACWRGYFIDDMMNPRHYE